MGFLSQVFPLGSVSITSLNFGFVLANNGSTHYSYFCISIHLYDCLSVITLYCDSSY